MIQSDLRDGTRLSGSRPLTAYEERVFLRHVRRLSPRNRALITAQMFLGFRISEVLALTIGHVVHHGQIRRHVALPPRFLKGKRGNTRSVPIGPELRRALERYLTQRARKHSLSPTEPLFRSRFHAADGGPKLITRSMAEKIIKQAFRVISDDSHSHGSETAA
jgi:integrase